MRYLVMLLLVSGCSTAYKHDNFITGCINGYMHFIPLDYQNGIYMVRGDDGYTFNYEHQTALATCRIKELKMYNNVKEQRPGNPH